MIDFIQIILLSVIVIVTVVLVIIGAQVYLFIKEARQSLLKANKIIEDAHSITESVSRPLSSLASLSMGVKASTLISVAKLVKGLMSKDSDRDSDRRR
ncbi:MAG: hypothetical protein KBC15_00125 [Candidatus Levybacteria bacterium]|nr:hypothetical protein [Candidatus Levybacteria bacterium]